MSIVWRGITFRTLTTSSCCRSWYMMRMNLFCQLLMCLTVIKTMKIWLIVFSESLTNLKLWDFIYSQSRLQASIISKKRGARASANSLIVLKINSMVTGPTQCSLTISWCWGRNKLISNHDLKVHQMLTSSQMRLHTRISWRVRAAMKLCTLSRRKISSLISKTTNLRTRIAATTQDNAFT